MERIVLNAEIREDTGKSVAKRLRNQGLIPGVVYTKGDESIAVKTGYRDFVKLLHKQGENVVIDLKLKKNAKTVNKVVIIKEIQYNSLKEGIFHVDFQQIKLTENIRVQVPLKTKGDADAPGVKEGGTLEHILREVEIECLPTQIPKEIIINVATLNIGDVVYVKDLDIPEEITTITDPEQIAINLKFEAKEEEPTEEKPEEETIAEPEVTKQKKPEEGEAAPEEKSR